MSDYIDSITTSDTPCSFCAAPNAAIKKLIQGRAAKICDICVTVLKTYSIDTEIVDESTVNIRLKPVQIKAILDEHVINQEAAKKVLSVAVYNHIKRQSLEDPSMIVKNNVLLVGPTGCGKTLFAETLARTMNIPFGVADATTLTEAGYVGEDVESILWDLLKNSDMKVREAEKGIIYIDEIDKIASKTSGDRLDVSGAGVQRGLLKLLEGTIAKVKNPLSRREEIFEVDTTNILFILGGAFASLEGILKDKYSPSSIGFQGQTKEKVSSDKLDELRSKIVPEDLINFGLMPELIGRIPVIAILNSLTVDDIKRILVEPKNSIIYQYKELFDLDGIELSFTDDALLAIAELAHKRSTGARGIKSILENLLLDLMYESPSSDVKQIVIDREFVENSKPQQRKA